MPRRPHGDLWRPARDLPFLALVVAIAASLVRAVDQPGFDLAIGGAEISLVVVDLALALLATLCVLRLLGRGALPSPARAITAAAVAFFGWLALTSLAHGADAFVGAAKLLEYAVLALGTVLFVRRRVQLWALVGVLVAVCALGVLDAAADWLAEPGRRHGGFLGAHDLSALATIVLTLALTTLFAPARSGRRILFAAGAVGALGLMLSAALASLLGLYLAVLVLLTLAVVRRAATRRSLALTAGVVTLVTIGVIGQRIGDIGFVEEIVNDDAATAETASGWSQRLIYAYVGGRVFLENPLFGTGWYGELPPSEYARFLDDARRRFPEQPPHYFPPADGAFIPQQTYDQVLFELGLVGAALFLVLAVAIARTAVRVATTWPRGGPDAQLAYVPAAWAASLAGALAGAALFGGIPLTAILWLTLGVAALMPSLVPAEAGTAPPARRQEPAFVPG